MRELQVRGLDTYHLLEDMPTHGGAFTIVFVDEKGNQLWMENVLMQSAELLETSGANLDFICARLRIAMEAATKMSAALGIARSEGYASRSVVALNVVDVIKGTNGCSKAKGGAKRRRAPDSLASHQDIDAPIQGIPTPPEAATPERATAKRSSLSKSALSLSRP